MKISFIRRANSKLLSAFARRQFSGGHHHISGKVEMDRIFVKQEDNNIGKMISLRGLQHDEEGHCEETIFEHPQRSNIEVSPFDFSLRKVNLSGVPNEENDYVHEDYYGYNISDDVRSLIISKFN